VGSATCQEIAIVEGRITHHTERIDSTERGFSDLVVSVASAVQARRNSAGNTYPSTLVKRAEVAQWLYTISEVKNEDFGCL